MRSERGKPCAPRFHAVPGRINAQRTARFLYVHRLREKLHDLDLVQSGILAPRHWNGDDWRSRGPRFGKADDMTALQLPSEAQSLAVESGLGEHDEVERLAAQAREHA